MSGVLGLGFGVWGLRFGVWGLGSGVSSSGFRVSGFRVSGLEFRVSGSRLPFDGVGLELRVVCTSNPQPASVDREPKEATLLGGFVHVRQK